MVSLRTCLSLMGLVPSIIIEYLTFQPLISEIILRGFKQTWCDTRVLQRKRMFFEPLVLSGEWGYLSSATAGRQLLRVCHFSRYAALERSTSRVCCRVVS